MVHGHHGIDTAAAAEIHVIWCTFEHGIYVACPVAVRDSLCLGNSEVNLQGLQDELTRIAK